MYTNEHTYAHTYDTHVHTHLNTHMWLAFVAESCWSVHRPPPRPSHVEYARLHGGAMWNTLASVVERGGKTKLKEHGDDEGCL